MARYRKIDPRIWNDEKFRSLSDGGKLAFLFLLTHPHMTALGAMRATTAGLAEELGWSAEAFREAFDEASRKGMAEHDPKACLIALPNFIRYNSPESPNVVKSWLGSVDLLPECPLKNRTVSRAKAFAEALQESFGKAFAEAFSKGMPYQEQEPKQEPDTKKSNSEAIASGGDATKSASDLTRSELWSAGKSLLESAGLPKAQCGSFVGKLIKDYGDAVVVESVRAAIVAQPADPVEYLKAACQKAVGFRKPMRRTPTPENFDLIDYGEGGLI